MAPRTVHNKVLIQITVTYDNTNITPKLMPLWQALK